MTDTSKLIRLYEPLSNEFATDRHPIDEIKELSELFGRDFSVLLREVEGEWYFEPMKNLWDNRDQLPRLNDNEIPLDSPAGFRLVYLLISGYVLPKHNLKWVEKAYQAHGQGLGLLLECHRESNKTTFAEILLCFRLALGPTGVYMLVRGGYDQAQESGKRVSGIIARNLGFNCLFPYLRPDVGDEKVQGRPGGSWNISGYNIIDIRVAQAEWDQLVATRKGRSLMVVSPDTAGIRGSRVSMMLMDDLVVSKHSRSDSEMEHLIKEVNRSLLKTLTNESFLICLGTPQRRGDLLEALILSERFEVIRQPLINPDKSINWPAKFSPEVVDRLRNEDLEGGRGFAAEMMLDRSKMEEKLIETWLTFPAGQINTDGMYLVACVDPATYSATGGKKTQSHAAITVFGLDNRTALEVVIGGWLGQKSLFDLANQIALLPWTIQYVCVEEDGVGAELIEVMTRQHPGIKVLPVRTKGLPKRDRVSAYLAPQLASGVLRISDSNDPYMIQVREALTRYGSFNERSHLQDVIDSLTWAAYMIRGGPGTEIIRRQTEPEINPFYAFGSSPGGDSY